MQIDMCAFSFIHTFSENSCLKTNNKRVHHVTVLNFNVLFFYLQSEVKIDLMPLLNTLFSSPRRAYFDQIKVSICYETLNMAEGWRDSSAFKNTCFFYRGFSSQHPYGS